MSECDTCERCVHLFFQLKYEMSNIIKGMIVNYTGLNRTTEHTWDYIQRTVSGVINLFQTRLTQSVCDASQSPLRGGNVALV